MPNPRRNPHARGINMNAKRFIEFKKADTGVDPRGCLIEFINKDVRKNIDVHRDQFQRKDNLEARKDLPAVGCTKKMRSSSSNPSNKPVRYTLETDHISFKPQEKPNSSPFSNVVAQIINKPRFTKANTSESWVPPKTNFTLNNCTSTTYNIINFQENPNAVTKKATNINAKRGKGITEFSDKNHVFAVKYNPDFQKAYQEDPRTFAKKTGIFSHMYDASARHGYITMPFEKHQSTKPAFKC